MRRIFVYSLLIAMLASGGLRPSSGTGGPAAEAAAAEAATQPLWPKPKACCRW